MMKKLLILLLVISFSLGTASCSKNDSATADQQETQAQTESVAKATEAAKATELPTIAQTEAAKATAGAAQTDAPEPTEKKPAVDPHTIANEYDLSSAWFERQSNTDYGTLLTDVAYFSTTADDYKRVNILLPPNYDADGAYPVLYMFRHADEFQVGERHSKDA